MMRPLGQADVIVWNREVVPRSCRFDVLVADDGLNPRATRDGGHNGCGGLGKRRQHRSIYVVEVVAAVESISGRVSAEIVEGGFFSAFVVNVRSDKVSF